VKVRRRKFDLCYTINTAIEHT